MYGLNNCPAAMNLSCTFAPPSVNVRCNYIGDAICDLVISGHRYGEKAPRPSHPSRASATPKG